MNWLRWRPAGPSEAAGYVVLLIELALTAGVLAHFARGQWFFFDDWRFTVVEHLGHDPVQTFFLSHNGHWVTLPFLEFRTLFTVFGASSYAPYVATAIAVHIVVCVLLFCLARRGGAGALESAVAVGLVAFAGVGVENMLWAFQTTFTGAIAFGLGALLVLTGGALTARRGLAVGALTLGALMCSGIGLAMLVVVAVGAALLGGRRGLLRCLWLPLTAYLLWYLFVGRLERPGFSGSGPAELVRFATNALSAAIGGLTNVRHATAVVCVVLVLVVAVDRFHPRGSADRIGRVLAAAGMAGVLAQLLLTGLTRAGLSPNGNIPSRYSYVVIVLLFPSMLRLIRRVVQRAARLPWSGRAPLAVVTALAVLAAYVGIGHSGVRFVRAFADYRLDYQHVYRDRMLGTMRLAEQGTHFANTVSGPTTPLPLNDLRRTARRFAPPSAKDNPVGVFEARAVTQVVVSTDGDYYHGRYGPPLQLRGLNLSTSVPEPGRCTRLHVRKRPGSLLMTVDSDGGMITLKSEAHYVDTRLIDGSRHTRNQRWRFGRNDEVYAASTAAGMSLQIFLPAGFSVLVCQ